MKGVLEIKNLVKQFGGVRAIDSLTFSIPPASITGIVGPNGSGKSTIVNILTGLLPLDGGVVLVDGDAFKKILPHKVSSHGITRTFQNIRLFEQMTVLDNILVVLTDRNAFQALFERHGAYHLKKAEEFLRRVNLWEKRNELAISLSYGQRKLLEIARALAMTRSATSGQAADIYFFDEPFAGLFPEMAKIVSGILKELRQEKKAVVLIEHDMGIIRELSDRILVLDAGKLIAAGNPDDVLGRRDVIEAYLGD